MLRALLTIALLTVLPVHAQEWPTKSVRMDDRTLRSGIVGEITHVHRWGGSLLGEAMRGVVSNLIRSANPEIAKSLIFALVFHLHRAHGRAVGLPPFENIGTPAIRETS